MCYDTAGGRYLIWATYIRIRGGAITEYYLSDYTFGRLRALGYITFEPLDAEKILTTRV